MDKNISYYSLNAREFVRNTASVDMTTLYTRFLSFVIPGGRILDAGCGSGRDAKAFSNLGYSVSAFDATPELAELASLACGFEVPVMAFADMQELEEYDGIWCCASLLHVPIADMSRTVATLWRASKPGGCLYASYKLGAGERSSGGRVFTDADDEAVRAWFKGLPDVSSFETWITEDQRPESSEKWINVLVRRAPNEEKKLITGGDDHFLPHLSRSLASASHVEIAVAFVKTTGLRLLYADLLSALGTVNEGASQAKRIKVLTSDYLDVTDPEALRLLLLLKERGADVRIFTTKEGSFHLKAYIFSNVIAGQLESGTAFIGSSNMSRQALKDGLEWNYRVVYPSDRGFLEARARFDELFVHSNSIELTDPWIEDYERRRVQPLRPVAPGSHEQEPPPEPTPIQKSALDALRNARDSGVRRGLVVLATGLGKTWLAAFDSARCGARRVLFVAHREEILTQAAQTFVRLRPKARVGLYMGQSREAQVDVLCASVQTLARAAHLEQFSPQHFDYVVIDEFHHAAASTYRKIIKHFAPSFLLGLTATPDRTDQSDILSLCDDNLVFTCDLFAGIEAKNLAAFHYYGILDESVDYKEIPWRSGKFDPEQLSNKLATLARSRHALQEWRARAQRRTLAFCVSVAHADFMASQFNKAGVPSGAVYSGSKLGRGEALESLLNGQLSVVFSVDLFNEGVDLPSIDTVMMLRPTESKILFLQQLGRGLRMSEGKPHLVVIDFVGNHVSFLQKPQALFGVEASYKALAEFARQAEEGRLNLPAGCYVNYDLRIIDFLKMLDSSGPQKEYEALKNSLGRRPNLAEFYRSGASVQAVRGQYGSWFAFVGQMDDLSEDEVRALGVAARLLHEVEVSAMTKCFKMVLLEAFLELDGLSSSIPLALLAGKSMEVIQRRKALLSDLPDAMRLDSSGLSPQWRKYWVDNPVNAWIGGNVGKGKDVLFELNDDQFSLLRPIPLDSFAAVTSMTQELVDYRLASYEARQYTVVSESNVVPLQLPRQAAVELPYFPNLRIACGHFKEGRADSEEHRSVPAFYGQMVPSRHFIAKASGDSMQGGDHPIHDGDLLLLELTSTGINEQPLGDVVALERSAGVGGDHEYLLREIQSKPDGTRVLRATNPAYPVMAVENGVRPVVKLLAIVDPLDLLIGKLFMREEIPTLFGEVFNPGSWNSGHIFVAKKMAQILLVTINKQGKAESHRYHDHWIDDQTFHWQSQNSTVPHSKRGHEIIHHAKLNMSIHLFVRDSKLLSGKAAPFVYHGKANYVSHIGSAPMSVTLKLR